MKKKRILVAVGALSSVLAAACSTEITDGPGMTPGGPVATGTTPGGTGTTPGGTGTTPGGTGTTPGGTGTTPGGTGTTPGAQMPGGPTEAPPVGTIPECVPGLPATSQIPRLLNRHYENTVRDLLGVEGALAEGKTISELLISDFDGAMTPDAWRAYQDVAAKIAANVMSGPNKSKFIACDPAAAGCMTETIKTFGRKAFRRPLTDAEVKRFEALGNTTPKGTPAEVAESTLQAFLVSPSFIMVSETGAEPGSVAQQFKLTPHETATKLAFLLWGSVPDEALNKAADDGQLTTAEQIRAQADRMIQVRAKTGPLVSAFHREWAQMNNPSGHWWERDHDKKLFPLYDAAKKVSWKAEMDAFFEDVAFTNGSFDQLLLSPVAFINKDNAALYGKDPGAYTDALQREELDPTTRPGFLTRVGFLSSHANYDSTSPILRGAFITVYLLGVNPGAPIPGAAMKTVDGMFATQRAYTEALTSPSECKGCHGFVNPSGFVLEGYDALGAAQTKDPRGGLIDASVTTATVAVTDTVNKTISSPLQLMQEIIAAPKSKQLYAQSWVAYAFGRPANKNDQCVANTLSEKMTSSNLSILGLMGELTQADAFRLRVQSL